MVFYHTVQWKYSLIVGDSISHGYNDEVYGGWVNRLKIRFIQQQSENKEVLNMVNNYSHSGHTSTQTKDRLKEVLPWNNPNKIERIIIATGINDTATTSDVSNEEKFELFKKNIEQLVASAKEVHSNVLVMGLTPVREADTQPMFWAEDQYYYNENVHMFDEWLKHYCQKESNTTYIPLFDLLTGDDIAWDGLHPNAKGHKKIFDEVYNVIQ